MSVVDDFLKKKSDFLAPYTPMYIEARKVGPGVVPSLGHGVLLYYCLPAGSAGINFSSFFFSIRRRHTRCYRDWSSDVCSSDLGDGRALGAALGQKRALGLDLA